MEKVLQSLLENELLTEDVKTQISEAFTSAIQEVKDEMESEKAAKITEAEAEVRSELAAKFVEEKEKLAESFDAKLEEVIKKEIDDLKEDIENFRDLEVENAQKLEEEKAKLAEKYVEERDKLVEAIDEFVSERVDKEFVELAEDIRAIREESFARNIFESFRETFEETFGSDSSLGESYKKRADKLEAEKTEAEERIAKLEENISELNREKEKNRVLAPLTGKKRSVMETILDRVETDRLEEVYEKMLPKVISRFTIGESEEGADPDSSRLNEGDEGKGQSRRSRRARSRKILENVNEDNLKTGDLPGRKDPKAESLNEDAAGFEELRHLSGIKRG